MASERLQVILELVSGQYKREARAAATATGTISSEASKASTATGRMGEKLSSFGGIAKTVLAGAAGAAVVGFAKDSVRAFSDLEQAVGGTEAVFGDHAAAVEEMAARSATALGLSEAEFRTATTSIGGQLKRLTGDVDFAAERSVELTSIAADLAATYGGTTAEAVQALGAAFRGEADPAERFNLDLKVSRVNAKAVELGLAATTREVDDYAKAQATIALILEQSSDAQGQFGREADTVAGQMQRLNARFEDFKAQLGEQFVPVAIEAMNAGSNLLDAFDEDVNLGWSQRLSAAMQTLLGESAESVDAYIRQKEAINDVGIAMTDQEQAARDTTAAMAEYRADGIESADKAMQNMARRGGKEAQSILREIGEEAESAVPSIYDMRDAVAAVNTAMLEAADPIFGAVSAYQRYQEKLAEVDEDGERTNTEMLELAEAALEANAKIADLGSGNLSAGIQALADALGEPYGVIQNMLEDVGILDGTEINLLFRASMPAADRALLNAASRVATGGGGGGVRVPTGNFRAMGGPVAGREPYIVGERGPELFIPQNSGFVMSNADMQRLLAGVGSSTHNYNIPIQSSGNSQADAQLVGAVASVLRRMETI